jgi:acylphosphatase
MNHVEIIVYGRVQGVGYRYFVIRVANRLHVRGWVKNMPDGTVKVVAEAPENDLEIFIDELKKEHSSAYIEKVNIIKSDNLENFKNFEVRF